MPVPGEVMVGGRRRGALPLTLLGLLALVGLLVLVGTRADAPGNPLAQPVSAEAGPQRAAEEFLAAWAAQDWPALQARTADPSLDAAGVHAEAHRALQVQGTTATPGQARLEGEDRATVPARITWDLGEDLGAVRFDVEVPLTRLADGTWRVRWWYPVLHPDLTPERRFQRVRVFRERAPILGRDGEPLVTTRHEVEVSVDPDRVSDPEAVTQALATHTSADPSHVGAVLAGEVRGEEAVVATLPLDAFEEVRFELDAVPGVTYRREVVREEAVPGLSGILGSVGEITAEVLDELGAPYRIGDTVGRSGLERAYERRLAGDPQQEARIVEGSQHVATLAFVDGAAPEPVQLTLDPGAQEAGREALQATSRPAALVAVHIPSGEIRAAVSTPEGELQRALVGRYAPGSTFKVVTGIAALAAGRTPADPVPCPPVAQFGGRQLRNAGGYGPGDIPFVTAMARSCNTAFATLANEVGAEAVTAAAQAVGFDVDYEVGLPATGATFPEPDGAADLAGAAIGQGRVEASPMHMASVMAAAMSGTWRSPHLIAEVEVQERALPEDVLAPLQETLRAVVTEGTGRAADLPGAPVHGKTGSAQFGTGPVLDTHAWFVGAQGELAVAVLVEGGGGGGAVAAPIAARFLGSIPAAAQAAEAA